MKSLVNSLLMVVFLATVPLYAEETIEGNKNVESLKRELTSFDRIVVENKDLNVYLITSSSDAVYIQADENLHDIIKTEVVDGVLQVTTTKTIESSKKCNIYIAASGVKSFEGIDKILYTKPAVMNKLDRM